MKTRLRILHLEDDQHDAELIQATLEAEGIVFDMVQVATRDEFLAALEPDEFDLILSDYALPSFDGLSALELVRARRPDVPFIFVSGMLGEELAIETLKKGATDYVLKQRLSRLGSVVRRALQEAEEHAERKRAEEALQESEARYRTLFEDSRDAISITTCEGFIVDANQAVLDLSGYTRAEISDINVKEIYTHSEDRDRFQQEIERQGAVRDYEIRFRKKDGTERDCLLTATVRRAHDGHILGYQGIVRDVTERKQAERRLVAEHAVTLILAESATLEEATPHIVQTLLDALGWDYGAIWRVERFANVLRCVDFWRRPEIQIEEFEAISRQITFAPGQGLPGRVWISHAPLWVSDVTQDPTFLRMPMAANVGLHGALIFPILSGDEVFGMIEFFSHEIRQPDKDLLQMMHAIGSQIGQFAQRKLFEEQFRQAQKMEAIGQLAGGVAHDFNNLLTTILGYAELITMSLSQDDPLHHHAEEIRQAGERAAGLTRQLLAFSRKQMLQLRVLDLNTVIADSTKMLQRLIGENIDLITVLDPALGPVKADPGQLGQVLINLAANARDAMPQGGTLTIETANVELDADYARRHVGARPGPYVMLVVSDTGHGMDQETQAHIFEPFFTTKEPGKGTGLGLPTVYGIVKQSEGNIWVYSEVGQGTTFKIYLPRVEEPAAAIPAPTLRADIPRGSETILLVEDEEMVRLLARDLLRTVGYTVLEAANGGEALLQCERYRGPIHLMITDVVLPQMNGRELADRVGPLRPEMKVLYMSGYTDNAIVHLGILEEGTVFLQKPFTLDVLARMVRVVLDG